MSARRSVSGLLVLLCAVAGCVLLSSTPALAQREHVFSSSFGSAGSGDGQFSRPGQVAVNDSTGDVYVIDRGNKRVEIFNAEGTYIDQFNGSASPTGAFSWPYPGVSLNEEGAIAVDNSTNPLDPSAGDVYVVDTNRNVIDKFTANGTYIGQVVGISPTTPFESRGLTGQSNPAESNVRAIAVDPDGSLWVNIGYSQLAKFNDAMSNEYVSKITVYAFTYADLGFSFDSEGDIYLGRENSIANSLVTLAKYTEVGELLTDEVDGENTTSAGVDLSSNDVYIDHEKSMAAYGPSGSFIESFGASQLQDSEGLAVNSSTGTVYASDAATQTVDVFTAFVLPDVTTGSASNFGETSVTIGGTLDPDGVPVTSCEFEYATDAEYASSGSYGQSVPCSQTAAQIGSDSAPVAVSANLSGLELLTGYHFRLKASNANGSNIGRDRTFLTPEPVALSEASISDVSSESARFSARIDPGGAATTYQFEYGTSTAYGQSVPIPAGEAGAETSSVPVAVRVQGLAPVTTYHVRVVASNVLGRVYGADQTFTTQATTSVLALPDGRMWEMVSPPSKQGASIEPLGAESPIEASEDGSAIAYVANAPIESQPAGNATPLVMAQVLSRRDTNGWSSQDISLPNDTTNVGSQEYNLFSTDLSQALVEPPAGTSLSPEASEPTIYLRNDVNGDFTPLVTASNVPPDTKFAEHTDSEGHVIVGVHPLIATPDLLHVLLSSPDALTPNTVQARLGTKNIYEWSEGHLTLVNVLPDGQQEPTALLGSNWEDIRHAISNDGSRVFWSQTNEQSGRALYMTDTVTGQTVQVDAPAPGVPPSPNSRSIFETASADGSKVFFLDAQPLTSTSTLAPVPANNGSSEYDLYVYDAVTGGLTDLSVPMGGGERAEVQSMVLGASEDGSIVYFVAKGVLASGAQPGKENLYVDSEAGSTWSAPRLIATLSEDDKNDWGGLPNETYFDNNPAEMTSRVSPDGQYLAFMSDESLTGYDNRDANSGQPDEEVFVYDEPNGQLKCASCNPTGARPEGVYDEGPSKHPLLVDHFGLWQERWIAGSIPGWTTFGNVNNSPAAPYQSRYLSDEGRLFFDSSDALVAQDTNDREDVYEYEPPGLGSCFTDALTYQSGSGGCVSLISAGTSSEESAFMDASASGNDVFFLTASKLSGRDADSSFDVYDAHACSVEAACVSVPVAPPPCDSGDSCKAAPSPQPAIFGAPASSTFSGAGNVVSVTPVVKAKAKSLTRARKLAVALKACHKRKRKRGVCESRARKEYGAPKGLRGKKSSLGQGRR